jgi:hypothetical protein
MSAKARVMSAMRHRRSAPTEYPVGWFTELIYRHCWPPMFEPRFRNGSEQWRSSVASAARQKRVEAGDTGTIVGISRKSDELISARLIARVRSASR